MRVRGRGPQGIRRWQGGLFIRFGICRLIATELKKPSRELFDPTYLSLKCRFSMKINSESLGGEGWNNLSHIRRISPNDDIITFHGATIRRLNMPFDLFPPLCL